VTTYSDEILRHDIDRVWRLARLLDSKYQIFGYRVGLDPIIGLIPGAGDLFMALVGIYPIIIARKHRIGGKGLAARMAMNLLIDWAVGEVPILGDLFDVYFKANLKNAQLLENAVKLERFR